MAADGKTEFDWVDAGGTVKRRVLAHEPGLMTVEVQFGDGDVGAPHHHPHVQSIFVKSGVFDFTIGGVERRLSAGDALVVPGNVVHGCRVVEAGTLIDTFTPRRDDFL